MLNSFATFIRTFRISPEIAFRKVYEAIISKLTAKKKRLSDFENTTFSEKPDWLDSIRYSYYQIPSIENLNKYKNAILNVAEYFLEHKFNLLGSGWVEVCHGAEVPGLEGYNYASEAKFTNWADWLKSLVTDNNYRECVRILNNINQDYKPIDWQLDFKSGFRWSETCWYKDIKYGDIPGADIKVPWELGRMQHLILLAYAYSLSNSNPDKYSDEYQNEVLDFIASNPPRYGVQWMYSMDVGIRAVNWLVAYDLFKSAGVEFGEEFESIFARSIYEHGIHILNNLEWSSGLRGNHYLSNVVSLLYIAAYLPVSEKTNLWLAFALQEFIYETYFQFLPDGGNFEASLNYHAFASEMVMHSVALILALPEDKGTGLLSHNVEQWEIKKRLHPLERQDYQITSNQSLKFSDNFLYHLIKIAEFSYSITLENGHSAQIGDNDSGRFLKFTPDYSIFSKQDAANLFSNLKDYLKIGDNGRSEEEHYYHENFNNQLIPIAVISCLIKSEKMLNHRTKLLLEHDIIKKMLRVRTNDKVVDGNSVVEGLSKLANDKSNIGDENIMQVAFPNFGLYINNSINYTSLIRCGQIGQLGKGGHAHNDQLSFNLSVNGRDFIIDAGTYLYTALKEKRNLYRSTRMHNTLFIEGYEQNKWSEETKDDLFWLCKDRAKADALQFSDTMFIGEHYGFGKPHKRIITFNVNSIDGVDICEINKEKNILFHLAPDVKVDEPVTNGILLSRDDLVVELTTENSDKSHTDIKVQDYFYSPSYGIIQKAKKIILISSDNKIKWEINIKRY